MACCTTIPPLNNSSGGQKRTSGGLFDLPKSAKRRRPFTSTSVTTLSASTSAVLMTSPVKGPNSMFSQQLSLNKPLVIDAKSNNVSHVHGQSGLGNARNNSKMH